MPDWLKFFRGRRVLVTGHTGFKGGWLTAWLKLLGSEVTGVALEPDRSQPCFFDIAEVAEGMRSVIADIREPGAIAGIVGEVRPEIIFHMAAQSLVIESYKRPVDTFMTNVMGTVHALEAARTVPGVRAFINATSDKCYENLGLDRGYREDDRLGGSDPYSASKAGAELVSISYGQAFPGTMPALASVRAGNVIGGGDWAQDRLIPDIVRALSQDRKVPLRNPRSVRPWQFVLEPLSGYMMLAAALCGESSGFQGGWNFGPSPEDQISVLDLAHLAARLWGKDEGGIVAAEHLGEEFPEAPQLRLDSSKARAELGWAPVMNVPEAVSATVEWYSAYLEGEESMPLITRWQIEAYAGRLSDRVALLEDLA